MNRLIKLLGLATAFLFAFLLLLLASSRWQQRRGDQLRVEALAEKQAQFLAILALAQLPPAPWTEQQIPALERAIGGSIKVEPVPEATDELLTKPSDERWQFTVPLASTNDGAAYQVTVSLPAPPTARLARTYQYVASALLALAFSFLFFLATAAVWISRRDPGADPSVRPTTTGAILADVSSLAQLAKTSVHQSELLEVERVERLRLEEDLSVHHMLLNRALEQKVRLGQDLHDGIIQSLYANGLTLEVAKGLIDSNPAEVRTLLAKSQHALNTTIREVRAFIHGLTPESLSDANVGDSVRSLVASLASGTSAKFRVIVDDVITNRLPESEQADVLQIIREAVTNSVRHGEAAHISISLHGRDHSLNLEIRDDGRGFDPKRRETRGHGLTNIEARAQRLGARWSIASEVGTGTSITLNFAPVVATP